MVFIAWSRYPQIYLDFPLWFFDKESYCVEYVEQNCWRCLNNFNFWCKVRALDRFEYKVEGE